MAALLVSAAFFERESSVLEGVAKAVGSTGCGTRSRSRCLKFRRTRKTTCNHKNQISACRQEILRDCRGAEGWSKHLCSGRYISPPAMHGRSRAREAFLAKKIPPLCGPRTKRKRATEGG